jgi:hypothetical protein
MTEMEQARVIEAVSEFRCTGELAGSSAAGAIS